MSHSATRPTRGQRRSTHCSTESLPTGTHVRVEHGLRCRTPPAIAHKPRRRTRTSKLLNRIRS